MRLRANPVSQKNKHILIQQMQIETKLELEALVDDRKMNVTVDIHADRTEVRAGGLA